MNLGAKLGATVGIIVIVVFLYVFFAATQPATNAIIETANATANWTGFESTQAVINAWPLYMWFLPGLFGIVGLVITWRFPNAGG